MKKVVITGCRTTVGTHLVQRLENEGIRVFSWEESNIPTDDYHQMERFLARLRPDALYHLFDKTPLNGNKDLAWHINYTWPSELAWLCQQLDIRFIFTSSALVFGSGSIGPFSIGSMPNAIKGYGYEKWRAERRVLEQNPFSRVVRLGWQISLQGGENQMVAEYDRQMAEHGSVEVEQHWLPACSMAEDTAEALIRTHKRPPGLYQFDSNLRWSQYDIARALKAKLGRDWKLQPVNRLMYDQRLIDSRLLPPLLNQSLPLDQLAG